MILYDHPSSGNCMKAQDPAAAAGASLRARDGRPVQGRDPQRRALRPQPGRAHPGSRARLRGDDRRVRRDPHAPRRRHRATSRTSACRARGCAVDALRAEPHRGGAGLRPLPPARRAGTSRCPRSTRTGSSEDRTRSSPSNRGLSDGRDFVAGDYSIADIALYAYVHCADDAGADPRSHAQHRGMASARRVAARVRQRPRAAPRARARAAALTPLSPDES